MWSPSDPSSKRVNLLVAGDFKGANLSPTAIERARTRVQVILCCGYAFSDVVDVRGTRADIR